MKNKILLVLSLLFGLFFINSGLNKFLHYMPMPKDISAEMMKDFGALMEISWLMPLIAVAEIIGGLLIMLPKTRALGALVLFPVIVGIALTHTLVDTSGLNITIAVTLIQVVIMLDSSKKYKALIG
jgi:uncharacterized membrane protein YphA (DoxX/SURF4 family)